MAKRWPMAKMLASSCEMMTKVVPSMRLSASIMSSRSALVTGSSPALGSSRKMIGGSSASARAIAARFCMPPEISEGCFIACAPRPTSPSLARAMSSITSRGRSVNSSSGSRTFSSSVLPPKSAPSWYMTPKRRRTERIASSSAVTMSTPPIVIEPDSGLRSVVRHESSVVLPQPEPPPMKRISPFRMSRSMPSMIGFPYPIDTPRSAMAVSRAVDSGAGAAGAGMGAC